MATKVSRPDHVFLPTGTWSIEWFNESEWAQANEDMEHDGVSRANRMQIRIRCAETSVDDYLRTLLVHELGHALWECAGLTHLEAPSDNGTAEENVMLLWTPTWVFFLKHNPHVVKWLSS